MYIKSIVLEGFKSYAGRTEISGLDRHFTAITGLNGSGKSNILDAICFVLGIQHLGQLRAHTLQDLVYKSGSAGINKATVSITLDNSDKRNGPPGYEQYDEITVTRQIVVGGKHKFLINGCNATSQRVQDLFQSVQLNINNPHFIIMQGADLGQITKVLNMRSSEILQLVEEAAGTRLYESKKEAAQKTIQKKETKLTEIDKLLREEINPLIQKLRQERASYLEYQKLLRELEHLTRLNVAVQYREAQRNKVGREKERVQLEEKIDASKKAITEVKKQLPVLEEQIQKLTTEREQHASEQLKALELEHSEAEKVHVQAVSDLKHARDELSKLQKRRQALISSIDDSATSHADKEKRLEALNVEIERLTAELKTKEGALLRAKAAQEAVNSGLLFTDEEAEEQQAAADKDNSLRRRGSGRRSQHDSPAVRKDQPPGPRAAAGTAIGMNEKIQRVRDSIKDVDREVKEFDMRSKDLSKDLNKRRGELGKSKTAETFVDKQQFDAVTKQIAKLEEEVATLKPDEKEWQTLEQRRDELDRVMKQAHLNVDSIESQFGALKFDFTDPSPNFDRKLVHGVLAKLVTPRNLADCTALEAAAGGVLYNVVVENEVVSRDLIKNGELQRRFTFIPLNKIARHPMNPDTVRFAQQLAGGADKVRLALSLIDYEPRIAAAVEFAFGGTLVALDLATAKLVTYHPQVMRPSVTMEGDQVSHEGTLTGGARDRNDPVLTKIGQLRTFENQLAKHNGEMQAVSQRLAQLKLRIDRLRQAKNELDTAKQKQHLMQKQMEREKAPEMQAVQEVADMERELAEIDKSRAERVERRAKLTKELAQLEHKLAHLQEFHEQLRREKKAAVDAANAALDAHQKTLDAVKAERTNLETEINNHAVEMEQAAKERDQLDAQILQNSKKIKEYEAKATESQQLSEERKKLLDKKRTEIQAQDREIKRLSNEQKRLEKQRQEHELTLLENSHQLTAAQKGLHSAESTLKELERKHVWLVEERAQLDTPGSPYDLTAAFGGDERQLQRQLQHVMEQKQKLEKTVNMRAMEKLDTAEERYNEVIKKRKVVTEDKKKLAAVIVGLDYQKHKALSEAIAQVNKEFGEIFRTLLPGSQAKLVPIESRGPARGHRGSSAGAQAAEASGEPRYEGLEFRVAFGELWKESLTELSGGQRSLVALSLILALLTFKPAPFYVLDEIDAALDISHTQNIGQTIKQQFPNSQFIVISLKDNMYNNANVLLKTKLVDGKSTVQRFVQRQVAPPGPSTATAPAASLARTSHRLQSGQNEGDDAQGRRQMPDPSDALGFAAGGGKRKRA